MYTTIKISTTLKLMLEHLKTSHSESYEDIIEDLVEDHLAINPQIRKKIAKSRSEIARGKFVTLAELQERVR